MFLSMDFLIEKRIGIVTMELLYIIFTYLTQGKQQECFRQLIILAVFVATDEPLASCLVVQFWVYISKLQLV